MSNADDAHEFLKHQVEQYKTYLSKNEAYGKSYKDYGAIGIIIRMNDKINRMKTITKSSVSINVGDESVRDSIKDLGCYCILALMELDRLESEQDDIHN
jgi:hypothetical protein